MRQIISSTNSELRQLDLLKLYLSHGHLKSSMYSKLMQMQYQTFRSVHGGQFVLAFVTPLVLGYMMFGLLRVNILKLHDTDNGNYEGYSNGFIWASGWSVAIFAIVMAIIFTLFKWKKNTLETSDYEED